MKLKGKFMKLLYVAMFGCGLTMAGIGAGATDQPQISAKESPASEGQMGVVVSVDANGHVTHVQHVQKLPPEIEKLLRETLDKWITKPAIVNGRRADSAIFMNVVLRSKQRTDGNYEASFDYISSQPAPHGEKYYSVVNGNLVMNANEREGNDINFSQSDSSTPLVQERPSWAPEKSGGATH
jgi:hypothetical protein